MPHIGRCAFCGRSAVEDIAVAIAKRKRGETIYCDDACEQATGLGRLFDEPEIERRRHYAKAVDGNCLDCGALERRR